MDMPGHNHGGGMGSGMGGGMGGGMDGGMGGGMDDMMGGCKISMLWNWNTIDACFIAESWRITSAGVFAGSCIGVVCLVMSLEFLRRLSREYERLVKRRAASSLERTVSPASPDDNIDSAKAGPRQTVSRLTPRAPPMSRSNVFQHIIRSALHMVQFGVAYFIMLLAMYYNGYFIICILIGAFLGCFVFGWDLGTATQNIVQDEATYCCG